MITVIFPHKTYSENKLKVKLIIKKYGMAWDDKRSGWVNEATGGGVFIDKSVMEMIMDDSFSESQPMTLYVRSADEEFMKEFAARCSALGGQVIPGEAPQAPQAAEKKTRAVVEKPGRPGDVFVRAGLRTSSGCNTDAFRKKGYDDLRDVDARWERRKRQLRVEYGKMGMGGGAAEKQLRRDEEAFRRSNACWAAGGQG